MAKRKKPTKYQSAYVKERKRVKDYISRRLRAGYIKVPGLDESIPTLKELGRAPTKRDVERLRKQYSAKNLKEYFGVTDPETGALITGKQAEPLKRKIKQTYEPEEWQDPFYVDVPEVDETDELSDADLDAIPDEIELVYKNFKEKFAAFGFTDRTREGLYVPEPIYKSVRDAVFDILDRMDDTEQVMLNVYQNQEKLEAAAAIIQNYEEGFNQAIEDFISVISETQSTIYEKATRGDYGIAWDEPS